MRTFDTLEALAAHVGEELAVSEWLPVSQERIATFATATDDYQWIHLDEARARAESPYKSTIAHGFLTLSLLPPLFASALTIGGSRLSVNYGLNRIRFTAPVLTADRIRARFVLQEYTDLNPGAQLIWKTTVEREGGEKPALIAEWIMRRYP